MPVKYHDGRFPPADLDLRPLIPLIGKAHAALARYDGLLAAIPNANVLLSPLTTQEAVLSSKIEGTQVTMGEVLEVEAGGEPEGLTQPRREDIEEVLNYREALMFCVKSLDERQLSLSLIKEAHARLMRGVRGSEQTPGRFRVEQNWIGPKGCTLDEASFVPIAPAHLQTGVEAWMAYVNDTSQPDALVQLALIHLEFEALHPFKDGNGRLGRMLIPLYLYQRRLLSSPNFYMSAYLERNRETYQERLRAVSRDEAWSEWIAFFLEGVTDQASENATRARAILSLYEQITKRVVDLTHSQHAVRTVDFIFRHPIFAAPHFGKEAEIPKPTAMRILNLLRESGLIATLREGRGRRFGVYAFHELLNLVEGRVHV